MGKKKLEEELDVQYFFLDELEVCSYSKDLKEEVEGLLSRWTDEGFDKAVEMVDPKSMKEQDPFMFQCLMAIQINKMKLKTYIHEKYHIKEQEGEEVVQCGS